jgi:hypothetical protein
MARIDTRNARILAEEDILEWLGEIQAEEKNILNSLLQEAEEFHDDDLREFCRRHLRLSGSVDGARAQLMAGVAVRDEALKDAAEMRSASGANQPKLPDKGP